MPTYLEYCFEHKILYFCHFGDHKIEGFNVTYKDDSTLLASQKFTVLEGVNCGDLKLDKFGNLYFIDRSQFIIGKIAKNELALSSQGAVAKAVVMYSRNTTNAVHQPEGLTIEREYVYWTNVNNGSEFGAIHKGFTEIFVKAVPFQTYEIFNIAESFAIAANRDFLFFTALPQGGDYQHPPQLYMMEKSNAQFYFNVSIDQLSQPKAILTYKDSKVLIADKGKIEVIDSAIFPPNATSWNTGLNTESIGSTWGLAFATLNKERVLSSTAFLIEYSMILIFALTSMFL